MTDLIDEIYDTRETHEDAGSNCSWCTNQGIIYLMGQLFCEDCAAEFRLMHAKVTSRHYDINARRSKKNYDSYSQCGQRRQAPKR